MLTMAMLHTMPTSRREHLDAPLVDDLQRLGQVAVVEEVQGAEVGVCESAARLRNRSEQRRADSVHHRAGAVLHVGAGVLAGRLSRQLVRREFWMVAAAASWRAAARATAMCEARPHAHHVWPAFEAGMLAGTCAVVISGGPGASCECSNVLGPLPRQLAAPNRPEPTRNNRRCEAVAMQQAHALESRPA